MLFESQWIAGGIEAFLRVEKERPRKKINPTTSFYPSSIKSINSFGFSEPNGTAFLPCCAQALQSHRNNHYAFVLFFWLLMTAQKVWILKKLKLLSSAVRQSNVSLKTMLAQPTQMKNRFVKLEGALNTVTVPPLQQKYYNSLLFTLFFTTID